MTLRTHTISSVQVREAYLQFMITIAKMIREDMNISKDDLFVQEEMAKVMELETDIANVSTAMKNLSGCLGRRKSLNFQQFDAVKTHGQRKKKVGGWGEKEAFCAMSSPEIRASVCVIISTACTAIMSALALAILVFLEVS